MKGRRLLAAGAAALLLAVGACGDDGGSTTAPPTTAAVSPGDVVFGEGELPENFPDDFPIPDRAVIGSTLVTPTRTEVVMVVPQGLEAVVEFLEAGLAEAGYEVVASEQQQFNWTIDFTEPGIVGNIVLNRETDQLSQLAVQLDAE